MTNGWQVPSYNMYGQTWNQQGFGMEWVFFVLTFRAAKGLHPLFANIWLLLMCVSSGSLSHRAGWAGLGRSPPRPQLPRAQSCPTWATTTWRVIKRSEPSVKPRGFFFYFFSFLKKFWSTALVQKGRGRIHKAFVTDGCFSTTGLSSQL